MTAIRHRFFPNLDQLQWESTWKMVYKWRSKRATTEQLATRTLKCRPRVLGHGTVLRRATELKLVAWALDLRRDGLPVSASMLAQKAREFAEEVDKVPVGSFVASRPWQTGVLWRHRLSMRARTRQGQHSNGDGVAAVRAFRQQVQDVIHSKSIKHLYGLPLLDCVNVLYTAVNCYMVLNDCFQLGITRVMNADQAAVQFEYLPAKALDVTGTHNVWIRSAGKAKDRLTAMLLGDSQGLKYPIFLVLKTDAKTASTAKQVDEEHHGFGATYWDRTVLPMQDGAGCEIYGNKKGWWNEGLTMAFLEHHFARRPNLEDDNMLLLLDDLRAHFTPR